MAMQKNNNNNIGSSCPTFSVTSSEPCDVQRTPSLQRQASFEKDTKYPSEESSSSADRKRANYQSLGSSGRGSGSAELSQDGSILVCSTDSGYSGNRRRSSTFNGADMKPAAIEEEERNEEVISEKEVTSKGTKRNREVDSSGDSLPSKIKRPFVEIEIEQRRHELDEHIIALKNEEETFTNERLKRLGECLESLNKLGSYAFKEATQDAAAATETSKAEEHESDSRLTPAETRESEEHESDSRSTPAETRESEEHESDSRSTPAETREGEEHESDSRSTPAETREGEEHESDFRSTPAETREGEEHESDSRSTPAETSKAEKHESDSRSTPAETREGEEHESDSRSTPAKVLTSRPSVSSDGDSFELQPEAVMGLKKLDCATLNVQITDDCQTYVSPSPGIQREESFQIQSLEYLNAPVETDKHGLSILNTHGNQLEILQLNCQCRVQSCYQQCCLKVREVMEHLKNCLGSVNYLPCSRCRDVLTRLYYHSNICEELKCPVPFCTFFRQHCGIAIDSCLTKLYNAKKVLVMTLMELGWLREDHQYDWVADNFKDYWMERDKSNLYLTNTLLQDLNGYGMFNTVQMCIAVPGQTDRYAIKKCCISQASRQEILEVMSKVTDRYFPQIADHLWCRLSDNSAYICTRLVHGGSLKKLINSGDELNSSTLKENRLSYFDQACMVAVHLRELRIVLLDWSSDHISLDETRQRLIFHDFSNAVILDSTKRYTLQNKKQLKPHLAPIEVCRKQARTSQSDVWGVGTLLYELSLGKTTFFSLSHEHPDVVRNKIGCGYKPDMTWCNDSVLKSLLNNCWHDDPNDRIFMQDARTHCIFRRGNRQPVPFPVGYLDI